MLRDLQEELGLAYVFVCHDLALIEVIADRVVVMRSGTVVESGTVEQVYRDPAEEYTRQLLDAIPVPVPRSVRAT